MPKIVVSLTSLKETNVDVLAGSGGELRDVCQQFCLSANMCHLRFICFSKFVFISFDVITSVSFLRGPTHSYVTSAKDRSPQDRYLTSHRYNARPTRLPSPTAEPAPEALLTRSEFPFTIRYVKGPPVVTSILCYNRHVWSYSFLLLCNQYL